MTDLAFEEPSSDIEAQVERERQAARGRIEAERRLRLLEKGCADNQERTCELESSVEELQGGALILEEQNEALQERAEALENYNAHQLGKTQAIQERVGILERLVAMTPEQQTMWRQQRMEEFGIGEEDLRDDTSRYDER